MAALNYLSKEGALTLTISAATAGASSVVKVGEQAFKIGGKLYTNAPEAFKALRQIPMFNKAYKNSIKGSNPISGKKLLHNEGKVETYKGLKKIKKVDDNLSRHHMPNNQ